MTRDKTPAERKAFLIHYARVLLREAAARRGQNVGWMLDGVIRARREAQSIVPDQPDLFGGRL